MHKSTVTPEEALKMLQEGNVRFVEDSTIRPNCGEDRRNETATHGQAPFVTLLSCSDSRVPAEYIFDRGIGDIFVVRVAGNIIGSSELASVEYAVDHLGTPLFAVLGHTKCGAVTAVLQRGLLGGNLRVLSEKILPAVERTKQAHPGVSEDQLVIETVKANVWKVIEDAFATSSCLKEKTKSSDLKVVGAVYDIHSGKINWMGTHPEQDNLLA
jgi:carbonic anhydrase